MFEGTIIPYASGTTPLTLTTLTTALPSTGFVSAIGFGETQNGITITAGGELSLSTGNMAFTMPRNGTITAIRAFFTNIIPVTLGATVIQISAQLYFAEPNSNVFRPLADTRVDLTPTLTGTVPANSTFTGSLKNLRVRVDRGTRLLLVFFASITGAPAVAVTVTGLASAGVNII
jgi:BclB C-terminal domain-containing protein